MKSIMKRKKLIQRFECPECGKFDMTYKQLQSTNACGKCETSVLPEDRPQNLICWNKNCKKEFVGTVANHKKYTMCPECKELATGMIPIYEMERLYHESKRK